MNGLHKKEIQKWNKDVGVIRYTKLDLARFLFEKKKFKELFIDFLLVGILLRIYTLKGKFDKIFINL